MTCNFKEIGTDPGDLDDTADPGLAVGIGGKIVPEEVNIVEVCQDADHINLLYILADVHGVFNYSPTLTIFYVDHNDEEQEVDATPHMILNYRGNPNSIQGVPFSTACGSDSVIFAYDIARVIPNFVSLYKMTLVLQLNGVFDTAEFDFLQDFPELLDTVGIFESSDPHDSTVFTKGISARPYKLFYDPATGELKLQFYTVGSNQCICNINCAAVSLVDQEMHPCDDEIQEVTVSTNSLVGNVTAVDITIRDSIGNVSDLSYLIVLGVEPSAPSVLRRLNPLRNEISTMFHTVNGETLDQTKVQYQIWKYVNNPGTAKLVIDWTTKSFKSFSDIDIHPGNTYGYAVRFRGEFQEVSNFSEWTVVTVD